MVRQGIHLLTLLSVFINSLRRRVESAIEIGFSWGQPNYGSLDSYFHDNEDQEQLDQLGGNAKKSIHAITTSP
ncbi:hypothetical protein [Burkholderia gladioli]|jgi:hypothetical protein|uniref:hypothetical protein n=1 Tax=Burkholderia gladioli TaxID=28095 RepID=UPI000A6DAF06|nr:hypothetical protein [Burkholderia gladioli]